MSEVEIRKERCNTCSAMREVKNTLCGDKVLLKCVVCNFWIRCQKCVHIMSAENHDCPQHNED